MLFTYPFFYAVERTVFRSQAFEKTWSNLRPRLEKGIELVAQETHPQGRSLLRKYVYHEPAVRRVVNDCLREIMAGDVMALFTQVQHMRRDIAKRRKQIIEWEKDLIGAPKRTWNPLDFSQSQLKERIEKAKDKNAQTEKTVNELIESSLEKFRTRGIRLTRAQVEFILNTAEGEDVASIMACADMVKQIFQRMEAQLKETGNSPDLSKTYAGFYMMCCRLYLEAIDRAIARIDKSFCPRLAVIEGHAKKQIVKAEQKMDHPQVTPAQKTTLQNNVTINKQILEVSKFYAQHLHKRSKELVELRSKASLNYEIAVNTFQTMKIGAQLSTIMKSAESDLSKVFEFEIPSISTLYDVGFGDQFQSVTKQLKQQ